MIKFSEGGKYLVASHPEQEENKDNKNKKYCMTIYNSYTTEVIALL